MDSTKMILRVQSSEGTARVEARPSDCSAVLFERVHGALALTSFAFVLHKDRARREEIISSKSQTLQDFGLKHGDMLFLSPVNGAVLFDQPTTSAESLQTNNTAMDDLAMPSTSKASLAPAAPKQVTEAPVEDDVDLELYKLSGNIERQRDEKLCRHNSKGCCVHCSPLEPWDEGYLKEHNIKHMSFHSYLRKIQSKNFISLNELNFKIKPGCTEHPPWPRGICSKCQPGAVTLTRQPYRHVDNVVVEHPAIVERFLSYWRATGEQRIGYLYGTYERHPDVPLGIRARVAAIYEPAQVCGRDAVALQPDANEAALKHVASRLGLSRIGWLFTDLLPMEGQVQHLRGVDTHFLSAQECIMAGHFQNLQPNACRHATSGYFGSKFVTVCVSGDASKQVHLEGYQVSGQCQAMVRDRVLLPTRDAPDLAYVRESSADQYVPDVYYKEKDAYGNEVGVSARRLPVPYLLVDVPCGVAAPGRAPRLAPPPPRALPPPHRLPAEHAQTLQALHHHIQSADTFLDAMSDLHVLVYLMTNSALALTPEQMDPLLAAVAARDAAGAAAWRAAPHAATLEHLARAASEAPQDRHSASEVWTCGVCTFHNTRDVSSCEMCAMPRNAGQM